MHFERAVRYETARLSEPPDWHVRAQNSPSADGAVRADEARRFCGKTFKRIRARVEPVAAVKGTATAEQYDDAA